jgi:dTDP-4-amino-4,6-dideoxygalactose transaminase
MLARRAAVAARFRGRWAALPVGLPVADGRRSHVYHRFVVACPVAATTAARRLARLGVTARRPVFQPIHRTLGLEGFPGAEQAYRHALSVPIYPALTAKEAEVVIRALQRTFA